MLFYNDAIFRRLDLSGLPNKSAPPQSSPVLAQATTDRIVDWRVALTVPNDIKGGTVLQPLVDLTQGKMIFPFTPTIILGHTANYNTVDLTHTNYPFYAYKNSQVDQITVTGDFFNENAEDARYWIACIHFLRTMTKMFYGGDPNVGKPPPISRLNGYGKHVFNNVPVLVTNFTTDLSSDVDYIACEVDNEVNYAPVQSTITVNLTPNYARVSHAKFNLTDFANGSL
jgi:hypothetical protein